VSQGETRLQGRRIPDDEWFNWQADGRIEPGDYGWMMVSGKRELFNCTPDGEIGYLAINKPDRAGNFHVVTEHEDGTISVGGSIRGQVFTSEHVGGAGPISGRGGWHGWLEHGMWRPA
jgi:hypothetical protein